MTRNQINNLSLEEAIVIVKGIGMSINFNTSNEQIKAAARNYLRDKKVKNVQKIISKISNSINQ